MNAIVKVMNEIVKAVNGIVKAKRKCCRNADLCLLMPMMEASRLNATHADRAKANT